MPLRAVLFDLDNTLVDFVQTKRACADAAIAAMTRAGLPIAAAEARTILYTLYREKGIEYDRIFQEFLGATMQAADPRILARGIVAYRQMQRRIMKPYGGVVDTLRELRRRGLRLGIVSDAPALKVWIRLAEVRIERFFDVVVTLADEGVLKPDPQPFLRALTALGIEPGEALFVGDRIPRDIAGARAVGMKSVLAAYGMASLPHPFPQDPEQETTADFTISSFPELLPIAASLRAAGRPRRGPQTPGSATGANPPS